MSERSPGRPRSDQARRAILDAALAEVSEHGYAGVTVGQIARSAGTGKQTIYRWWPSKADVVLDAVLDLARQRISVPDEGTLEADLDRFLRASFRQSGQRPALTGLMAEAVLDPDFAIRLRDRFLAQRREALRTILERAADRGELEKDQDLEVAIDAVFGVIWYRLLTGFGSLGDRAASELSAFVARGLER